MMLLAVALTARAFSFSATAPTGQTLYFDVTSAGAVSVVNPDWDYYATPNGDLEIPATVSNNGSTYTVTAIGQRAFRMCTGLTSVVVPQSVHSDARGCSSSGLRPPTAISPCRLKPVRILCTCPPP